MYCFQGWTWEYIDDYMTIPRLKAITAYQKDFPPIHVMLAAYFGAGKMSEGKTEAVVIDHTTGSNAPSETVFGTFKQAPKSAGIP